MKTFSSILLILLISGCISKSKFEDQVEVNRALSEENIRLSTSLEECQNGAERLVAIVKKAYKEKQYEEAKEAINRLSINHPEASENKEFAILYKKIEVDQKRIAEAEKKTKGRGGKISKFKQYWNLDG